MRIGIDARFYGSIGKGLGRYTQKLIEHLETLETADDFFVFLRKENFDEYQPKSVRFHKVLANCPWYSLREQIVMPRLLKSHQLDLVHFPHFNVPLFYRRKFVITIHDLILLHFPTVRGTTLPGLVYWLKFIAYRLVIWSAIGRAQRILTVSETTKRDIAARYPQAADKIMVTCEACDDFCVVNHDPDAVVLNRYDILKPYIMYVGNAYPHKNLERLIEAFGRVVEVKPDIRLVLVGKEDFFYRRLKTLVQKQNVPNVIFTGYVPDGDLDTIYKHCELYAFPSLYEGFGLPPLEAMAKGAVVASSDHPCMREVLGDSAFFFDGRNTDAVELAIFELLGNQSLRLELRARGYRQVGRYSWRRMATETQAAYRAAINTSR